MQINPVSTEVEQAFTELLTLAEEAVIPVATDGMWQAIACKTAAGNTHLFFLTFDDQTASEEKILSTLTTQKDTAIAFLLVMWNNHCIDLPSYSLRQKLIAMDEKNREALLVLRGENCLAVRTIGSTMPA